MTLLRQTKATSKVTCEVRKSRTFRRTLELKSLPPRPQVCCRAVVYKTKERLVVRLAVPFDHTAKCCWSRLRYLTPVQITISPKEGVTNPGPRGPQPCWISSDLCLAHCVPPSDWWGTTGLEVLDYDSCGLV